MKNKSMKLFTYQTLKEHSLQLIIGLVSKTLAVNKKCLVLCSSKEQVDDFDNMFWTRSLWLAHGKAGGKNDALQPALISSDFTLVNEPDFLFLFNKIIDFDVKSFERVFIIYTEDIKQDLQNFLKSLQDNKDIIFEHYDYRNGKYEKINFV